MKATITTQAITNDTMAFLKGLSIKTVKPMSKFINAHLEAKNASPQNIAAPFDSRELKEHDSIQQHNAELSY